MRRLIATVLLCISLGGCITFSGDQTLGLIDSAFRPSPLPPLPAMRQLPAETFQHRPTTSWR